MARSSRLVGLGLVLVATYACIWIIHAQKPESRQRGALEASLRHFSNTTKVKTTASVGSSSLKTPDSSVDEEKENERPTLTTSLPSFPFHANLTALPIWLQDYIHWHENTPHAPLLIVKCLHTDTSCGGTADRLQPLPLYLLLAVRLQRRLIVYWQRPYGLEEFLEPVTMDWRIPSEYQTQNDTWWRQQTFVGGHDVEALLRGSGLRPKMRNLEEHSIVTLMYQSNLHGSNLYDEYVPKLYRDNTTFDQVYANLWHSIFRPIPIIRQQVQEQLARLGSDYVAVHIRSQYQKAAGPKKTVVVARNALQCVSQLRTSPNQTIFVTTDNANSTRAALMVLAQEHPGVHVVASRDTQPLHLDRGWSFLQRQSSAWQRAPAPSAYYGTFGDLYLLAAATSRAVHHGNYAKWAHRLSYGHRGSIINHLQKQCWWKNV